MKNLKHLISIILKINNTDVKTLFLDIDQILQLIHLPPKKILDQLNLIQSKYFDQNIRMLENIYDQQEKDQFRLEGLNKIITDTPELKEIKEKIQENQEEIQRLHKTSERSIVGIAVRNQAKKDIIFLQQKIEKKISRFPKVIRDLFAEKKEINKKLKNIETQIEKIKKLNQDFTEKLEIDINKAPPVAPIKMIDTILNAASTSDHNKSNSTSNSKETTGPLNATPVFKPNVVPNIPPTDIIPPPDLTPPPPIMSCLDFDKLAEKETKKDPPPPNRASAQPTEIVNQDVIASDRVYDDMVAKMNEINVNKERIAQENQTKMKEIEDKIKQNLSEDDGGGGGGIFGIGVMGL